MIWTRKTWQGAAFYFLLACFFSSCVTYQEVKLKEIKSIAFQNDDITSGKIVVTVSVVNPNNYDIQVKEYDLNAFVNNNDMGKLVVEENIMFPKNSDQEYTFTVKPDLSKVLSLLPSLYLTGSADAAIRGKVKVKALFISKFFDVNLQKKISANDFQ
jgi:LEA14-like dessication related protein